MLSFGCLRLGLSRRATLAAGGDKLVQAHSEAGCPTRGCKRRSRPRSRSAPARTRTADPAKPLPCLRSRSCSIRKRGGLGDGGNGCAVLRVLPQEREHVRGRKLLLDARQVPLMHLQASEDVDRALTPCCTSKGSEPATKPASTLVRRRRRAAGLGSRVDLLPIRELSVVSNGVGEAPLTRRCERSILPPSGGTP